MEDYREGTLVAANIADCRPQSIVYKAGPIPKPLTVENMLDHPQNISPLL